MTDPRPDTVFDCVYDHDHSEGGCYSATIDDLLSNATDALPAHTLVRVDETTFDHASWECLCGKIGCVSRRRNRVGQLTDGDRAGVIAVKRHRAHAQLHRRWGT